MVRDRKLHSDESSQLNTDRENSTGTPMEIDDDITDSTETDKLISPEIISDVVVSSPSIKSDIERLEEKEVVSSESSGPAKESQVDPEFLASATSGGITLISDGTKVVETDSANR